MDWERARADYVTGKETYAQIAERYGVTKSAVGKRATGEGWARQRSKWRKGVADKVIAKKGTRAVERLSDLIDAVDNMMAQLKEITEDPKVWRRQYQTDIIQDEETGKRRAVALNFLADKPDTRSMMRAARTAESLVRSARDLLDLPNREQRHREKMDERRMKLMERKEGEASAGEGGIIEIPAVLPEEPENAIEVDT